MTQSTRVVDFLPEHQSGLVAMYQRNFGDWSTERFRKRWEWQVGTGNPWRALRPVSGLVVVNDSGVVGGMVLFPIPLRVDGKRLTVLCGGEFAVDRAHRVSSLATLVQRMMSMVPVMANGLHPALRKMGIRYGAHCLPVSGARFSLRLRLGGWLCRAIRRRVPTTLRRFVTPAATKWLGTAPVVGALGRFAGREALPRIQRIPRATAAADVRPLARFTDEYDALWGAVRAKFRITLDKDAEYMSWRYLQCPTFRDPIVRALYRDGRLAGVLVAGVCAVLDGPDGPCGTNGEILELIAPDATPAEIESLVLEACRELDRRGVDQVGVFGHDAGTRTALERVGFRPEPDERFDTLVLFTPAKPREGRAEQIDSVYITAGDGDVLTSSLI